MTRWRIIEQDAGAFALRIFVARGSPIPPKAGPAHGNDPPGFVVRSTSITIPEADSAALETTSALSRLASDAVDIRVWDTRYRGGKGKAPNETVQFIYPPGPPTRGVNVFGDIERFSFAADRAAIAAGGKTYTYATPSTITLTGALLQARHDRSSDGIQVPFEIAGRQAQIEARLEGEVRVNGAVLAIPRGGTTAHIFGWLNEERLIYWLTLAGVLVALVGLREARSRRNSQVTVPAVR